MDDLSVCYFDGENSFFVLFLQGIGQISLRLFCGLLWQRLFETLSLSF